MDPLEGDFVNVIFHLTSPDENWVHHSSQVRCSTQKQGRNGVGLEETLEITQFHSSCQGKVKELTKVKVNPLQLDCRSQGKEDISKFSTCSAAQLKPF